MILTNIIRAKMKDWIVEIFSAIATSIGNILSSIAGVYMSTGSMLLLPGNTWRDI